MERMIEVCCGSYDDALASARGGASRIELNSALYLGGLTPSLASLILTKKNTNLKVITMVRPRGAGFCYTDEEFDGVVKRNLYGAFYLCRGVVPNMKEKKSGKIIIISSGAGRMTSRSEVGRIPYAPSKAAQLGLMRQLALELAPYNIQVNAVAPGLIASTDYIENNWKGNTEEQRQDTLKKIPAGRRGTNAEVAIGIVFLAAEEAGYITGHCLDINGGSIMM